MQSILRSILGAMILFWISQVPAHAQTPNVESSSNSTMSTVELEGEAESVKAASPTSSEPQSLEEVAQSLQTLRDRADNLDRDVTKMTVEVSRMFKVKTLSSASAEWQAFDLHWAMLALGYQQLKEALVIETSEAALKSDIGLCVKNALLDRDWYELRGRVVRLRKRLDKIVSKGK